ncbi:MAG: MmgE/PrpD family protein, partial [Planctomycetota bacterium]
MPDTLADRLAEYAIATRFDDLPELVVHETKRRLIDALGCALGARHADAPRTAERVAPRIAAGQAASTLYGSRTSPDMAAFVNGILIRYLDFNDTYLS